jgi:hypothetical protein
MPIREPRNRRRDRILATERCLKKQQKRTQSKDGCRKNLVAAHRRMTHRAAMVRHRILFTKETREYRGSQKRLAVTRKGTTHCAKVARQKAKVFRRKLNQGLYESQKKKTTAAEQVSRPTTGANEAQPLTVNRSASWSMFWRQSKTIPEHNQWSHRKNLRT